MDIISQVVCLIRIHPASPIVAIFNPEAVIWKDSLSHSSNQELESKAKYKKAELLRIKPWG